MTQTNPTTELWHPEGGFNRRAILAFAKQVRGSASWGQAQKWAWEEARAWQAEVHGVSATRKPLTCNFLNAVRERPAEALAS